MIESTRVARAEIRARLGRPALTVGFLLASAVALLETLTPVYVNGDPVSRGWWGAVYGGSTGLAGALLVTCAVLIGLLGGDLDRGFLTERVALGADPRAVVLGQGLAAMAMGCATWGLAVVVTAGAALADLGGRLLIGRPAAVPAPPAAVLASAAVAPAVLVVVAALLWSLVLASGSGRRALVWLAGSVGTFLVLLVAGGPWWSRLLVFHPLAGAWRGLSALPWGATLPGAVHEPPLPYGVSAGVWTLVLAGAAYRQWRRGWIGSA
ncbi:MAG TPA: hypothetical protein PLX71_08525 [Phycicoccus sp.]|nr:hypothetical protein [Phycicoccus sp.]